MAGPLAEIYSASDSFKRKLVDALRNPMAKFEQIVGDANDRAGNLNEMTYAAVEDGPGRGPATDRLAKLMAESYDPVGMTMLKKPRMSAAKAALPDTPADPELEYLQKGLLQALREKKAGLSEFASTTPREIQKNTKKGGYSVNLPSGQMPSDGLMMGRYANTDTRNMVIPAGKNLTQADILRFANTNKNALNNSDNYLGTWQDGPKGATYLDTSKRFDPSEIRQATKFGEKTGQLAGYDVGAGQTIPVGNWKQFIDSPEFIGPDGRLAQMETAGRNYLSNYPTGNWWDIRGSNMEKVYGKENLPQVAGFTASTAPVSAPRENIQTMSEYMRRHLKGEPILQPDWRVPAGMMTRSEGVQIGMAKKLVKKGAH